MNSEEIKALHQQYIMDTYRRFPVALQQGEGSRVWDPEGNAYLDFTSGIGVTSLGQCDPRWKAAIVEQLDTLGHVSNLFYTEPSARLAQRLCQRTGMNSVFFANGGAEANEAMIKLARKYSYDKYGEGRSVILTLRQSFHGRTMTTLTATGQEALHQYFFPFAEGFRYVEPEDLPALEAENQGDVCAVMLELVQGEGGVRAMDRGYIQALRELCSQRDWLLLADEVQSGVGRTGTLFAFQQYGIQPDVCSFAKGIAGGLPLSGILGNEKCRDVFQPGTHGTTFGANPVCCAAALAVQEIMTEEFLADVAEKGRLLREGIEALRLPCFGKTSGLGLMVGIAVQPGWVNREIAEKLIENHLLVLTAGPGMRLMPPLTVTREEIQEALTIMAQVLG